MDINKILNDIEKININEYSSLKECLDKNVTISNDEYPCEYVDITHRLCQRWVYERGIDEQTETIIDKLGYNEGLDYWKQDMEESAIIKIVKEAKKNGFEDVNTDVFGDNYGIELNVPIAMVQLPLKPLGNEMLNNIDKLGLVHDRNSEYNDIYLNISSPEGKIQLELQINSDCNVRQYSLTEQETQEFLDAYPYQAIYYDKKHDSNVIAGIAKTEEEAIAIQELAGHMATNLDDIER